jgi:hypothetical protein
MIVVDQVRYRGLGQIRKIGTGVRVAGGSRAVAGGVHDGGDGTGGGVGDGHVDGDLVQVLVVQGLQVEGLVKLLLQAGRYVCEQVAEQG